MDIVLPSMCMYMVKEWTKTSSAMKLALKIDIKTNVIGKKSDVVRQFSFYAFIPPVEYRYKKHF